MEYAKLMVFATCIIIALPTAVFAILPGEIITPTPTQSGQTDFWSLIFGSGTARTANEQKSIFALIGGVFGIDDTSTFKFLSGNQQNGPGLSLGNFQFRFDGWDSAPLVSYRDPISNFELGWKPTSGIFMDAAKSYGLTFSETTGTKTMTQSQGLQQFNTDYGFDSYWRDSSTQTVLQYAAKESGLSGWYDVVSGKRVSDFNFGYEPFPKIAFDFGNNVQTNAESAQKMGAMLQWQKWAAELSRDELLKNNDPSSREDARIMGVISSGLDSDIASLKQYGDNMNSQNMPSSNINVIRNQALSSIQGRDDMLMSLSRANRPYNDDDTCMGRCLKNPGCETAMGDCPPGMGYTCCMDTFMLVD